MKTTTRVRFDMMMRACFGDPWLNATINAGREIILAENEDHEPSVAAYADRLGFSRQQARDVLRMIRTRATDEFLDLCSHERSGLTVDEARALDRQIREDQWHEHCPA